MDTKSFISYAQNREDAVLAAFLRDVEQGFYIDVGANDPEMDSVTKSFYERGWRGINIEPNPQMLKKLKANRPEDINIQAGISNKEGKLNLRTYSNSGLSTFSSSMQKQYAAQDAPTGFKDITVKVTTLKAILDKYKPEHVHFMKIDVEGLEYEVLSGNDWKNYRPEIICIEANHSIKNWSPILEKNNYELAWNDGLNDYYLANESKVRRSNFSYAEDMLVDRLITPYHVHSKITEIINERDEALRRNEALKLKVDRLTEQNKELEKKVLNERRLRYAARNIVVGVDKAIQAQIERLNQAKANESKIARHAKTDYNSSTAETLLDELQAADLTAYYSRKQTPQPKRSLIYKPVKATYFVPRKIVAVGLKSAIRLARDGKAK